MRRHHLCREEIACAPLHIHTLQGVGIVAHPELVEVRHISPVGTSATRSAVLYNQVGILLTDTLAGLLITTMVFNEHVALTVHGEILRTMVCDVHVRIPLDIIEVGILLHEVVNDTEHEILHLGIAEVEHKLRAATSHQEFTSRHLNHPVGVLLIQFADAVGHLRLNPYTELHSVLLGICHQRGHTVRQLCLIDGPVTQ